MPPTTSAKKPPATSGQVITRQLQGMILARGGSITALARECGIDPAVVQRFVNGERSITLDSVDKLADVLGLRLIEGARGKARPPAKPTPATTRSPRPTRRSRLGRENVPAETLTETSAEGDSS